MGLLKQGLIAMDGPASSNRFASGLTCFVLLWLSATSARADLWVSGYYAGWNQAYLQPTNIDFGALTHIIHFALVPVADGTLDTNSNVMTPAYASNLVAQAHAAKKLAIISVGGGNSQVGFQGATSSSHLSAFTTRLVNYMAAYAYDGIDLDWEPLVASDAPQFTNLVNSLRTALNGYTPKRLLTAAVASQPALFASIQNQFDQINLMTYDLAGPYSGWVTWFNSPIYDGGYRFASTGALIPSTDGMVTNFIGNGVASRKLGIGITFYGQIWSGGTGTPTGGATAPRQGWTAPPTMAPTNYHDLMATYYQSNLYHWDSAAQAAYLTLDNTGSANDKFISYDDEHACQAKVSYARNHRLGGVMIWELGDGYRAAQPQGQRDTLLQSIKQALSTPGRVSIQPRGADIQLSFTGAPLGSYQIQWTSNPASAPWNTLTNSVPATNGPILVTDPSALVNQPLRFYRVQSPP
jgi:chitinase